MLYIANIQSVRYYSANTNYVIGDNIKKGVTFGTYFWCGPTFFPKEWGHIIRAYQSRVANERGDDYIHMWSLHFSKGYVLPVVVRVDATFPEWHFENVEFTNDTLSLYNSGRYNIKTGKWENATVTADQLINRFKFDIDINSVITIRDLKKERVMGSWSSFPDIDLKGGVFTITVQTNTKYGEVIISGDDGIISNPIQFTDPMPIEIKIVPNSGYRLKSVFRDQIDASSYLRDNTIRFEKVCCGMTLRFEFEETPIIKANNYTREYGDTNPTFDYTISNGSITFGKPAISCEATATSPVGTYPIVVEKGSIIDNNITFVNGVLTITKAPLTISAGNYSKVEGEDNPEFSLTYSGFKNGETQRVLIKEPVITCSATNSSSVGTYSVLVNGAEAENYKINYVNGTLSIIENNNPILNDGETFTAKTEEGVELTFKVISAKNKTCQVGLGTYETPIISYNTKGALSIPKIAKGYIVTKISDYAFFGCRYLTNIVIPDGVIDIGNSAFWGCKGINTIDIPKSVKTIGGGAFENCSGLQSVTFPSGLTSLGNCIFRGCTSIPFVIIPKDVSFIGGSTFDGCTSISNVYCLSEKTPGGGDSFENRENIILHVPIKSILQYQTTYGWKDFGSIVALKDGDPGYSDNDDRFLEPYASLSDDNTTLKFYYDDKKASRNGMGIGPFYKTVNFEEGIVTDNRLWSDKCRNISTVEFDATFADYTELTSTAYWFEGCSNLKFIKGLKNLNTSNVTSMRSMFDNCSSLTSLDLGYLNTVNVTDMEEMFRDCSNLTSLDVSKFNTSNLWNLWGMFYGCSSLTSLDVSNFNITPSNLHGLSLNYMFYDCSSLKSLDLSNFNTNSITTMGSMFCNCTALTTIYCNNAWKSYEDASNYMFSGCTSLKGAISYDSNKTDVSYANPTTGYFTYKNAESEIIKFADSKVKDICIQYWDTDEDGEISKTEAASVLWIGNAFVESEITSFNEFSFFTAVTDIDDAAFRKCKNLKEITLPNSATIIGKQTFAYCQNLKKVTMSNSITTIGDYAFKDCISLANIEFSDKLTKIGDGAFENCSALSTFTIPASVFYIGGSPFDSCSGLTSISVDGNNMRYSSVGGVLFDKACTKLVQYPIGKNGSEYVIPSSVVTIGEGAFISSINLHTIIMPESVETIELGAFMYCTSLEMITIPQSVTSLAKYSFYGCTGLKSVTSMNKNPFEIESNVFETSNNTFTTATLYVPAGSASKYQAVGGWKNFKKFMPIGDVNGDNSINDADTKEEADYVMGKPSKTYVKAAGDMNGDGVINVVDIVLMNTLKAK